MYKGNASDFAEICQNPNDEAIKKAESNQQLMKQILMPYGLDKYLNKRDDKKPNKNKDSIAENVRVLLSSDATYEDEAVGMAAMHGISSEEMDAMDMDTKQQIMIGVDLDEVEYEEKRRAQYS